MFCVTACMHLTWNVLWHLCNTVVEQLYVLRFNKKVFSPDYTCWCPLHFSGSPTLYQCFLLWQPSGSWCYCQTGKMKIEKRLTLGTVFQMSLILYWSQIRLKFIWCHFFIQKQGRLSVGSQHWLLAEETAILYICNSKYILKTRYTFGCDT